MLVLINNWMPLWAEEPLLTIISAARYAIMAGANDKDSVIGTWKGYFSVQRKEDGTLEKF
jgi:hypothetical protein